MHSQLSSRLTRMAVYAMVSFNVILLTVNGVVMIIVPYTWYELVPGVTDTGFFNQHFVRDIGMIQLFLGLAFLVGMAKPSRRIDLWMAATVWLSAHALFHFWEVAVCISPVSAIPRDFVGVTLPALLGILLCLWALRRSARDNLIEGTAPLPSHI
ncbi:hypothetical protein ACMDCR_23860 [Labrys okinawensis]|uniref:hypothetical protein n=1 Tax=Labrys okinawensis TaxID=346911 RepID=UPI0039BCD1DC